MFCGDVQSHREIQSVQRSTSFKNVATVFCTNKHTKLSVPLSNHTSYTEAFMWGFASYRNVTWRFITHYVTHAGFKSSFGSKAAAGFNTVNLFLTVNFFQKSSHHSVISWMAIPMSGKVIFMVAMCPCLLFLCHEYWLANSNPNPWRAILHNRYHYGDHICIMARLIRRTS